MLQPWLLSRLKAEQRLDWVSAKVAFGFEHPGRALPSTLLPGGEGRWEGVEESGNGSQALQVCPRGAARLPWRKAASVSVAGDWVGQRDEEPWAELGFRPRCHFLIGVPVTHLHPPLLSPRPEAQPCVAGRVVCDSRPRGLALSEGDWRAL